MAIVARRFPFGKGGQSGGIAVGWMLGHTDYLAKLCWATKADPKTRFERLAAFCKKHGLKEEQEFFEKSLAVLRTAERH